MASKKTTEPLFTSGTEHDMWACENCDVCIKSSKYNEKTDTYSKVRCAVQRDIYTQMLSDEPISQRSYDACCKRICPYRQTEWTKRKKHTPKIEGQLEFDF